MPAAALHAAGEFLGERVAQTAAEFPQIGCDPVIYLQQHVRIAQCVRAMSRRAGKIPPADRAAASRLPSPKYSCV